MNEEIFVLWNPILYSCDLPASATLRIEFSLHLICHDCINHVLHCCLHTDSTYEHYTMVLEGEGMC